MFQLQLRHNFDSALPPSCHLRPFACHWSQFLTGFGACMLTSCQRKPNEHLCSTCASSFNWAHRAVNDPIGQTTASFPSGLHSIHLPLKHSWTLKRSCNNLLHFTKDLIQCFPSGTNCQHSTDYSNWSISYSQRRRHVTILPSSYLVSESLFYSPSALLFGFLKFSHRVVA